LVERPKAISFKQVDPGPRLGLQPRELELDGQRRGSVDRGVDAGGVSVQERAQERADLSLLTLRHAAHAERAHQQVRAQRVRAGELGQAAGGGPAEELELPQPVLPVAEAEREARVGRAAGAQVRHAVAVTQDLDRRFEPSQPQAAGGLRKRSLEELVPEADAGPDRGENGSRPDRRLGDACGHRADFGRRGVG
jgi:hypothetical protein